MNIAIQKNQIGDENINSVNARELHQFLEVDTKFNDWINRMLVYGFEENNDYIALTQKRVTAQGNAVAQKNYIISLDMAKEISMLQRSAKGKQARKYFIECEKRATQPQKLSRKEILALALQAEEELKEANHKLELQKPKVLFADAVSTSKTSILIGELAKIIKQNGYDIGAQRFFTWLRDSGYLIKRKGTDWNTPTQKAMNLGLFEIKETVVTHSDGHISINKTTKVTGKGQIYFINKFTPTPIAA